MRVMTGERKNENATKILQRNRSMHQTIEKCTMQWKLFHAMDTCTKQSKNTPRTIEKHTTQWKK